VDLRTVLLLYEKGGGLKMELKWKWKWNGRRGEWRKGRNKLQSTAKNDGPFCLSSFPKKNKARFEIKRDF